MNKDKNMCLDDANMYHPVTRKMIAGIGLGVTFYLPEGASKDSRLLLGKCSDDYLKRFPNIEKNEISYGKWKKANGQSLEEFLVEYNNPMEDFSILSSGARKFEDFSLYSFVANSSELERYKYRKGADYVMATIPLSALSNKKQDSFQQWVIDWMEMLKPAYFTAGYRIAYPIYSIPSNDTYTYPVLMRFPGLDDDRPWLFHEDGIINKNVKGAQWLTFLNSSHIEKLGGIDEIIKQLKGSKGFQFLEIADGLLIQAGDTPQFGDVNQNLYPEHYYQLGEVLAPLRYKEIDSGNYIRPPRDKERRSKTREWLARFDNGVPND